MQRLWHKSYAPFSLHHSSHCKEGDFVYVRTKNVIHLVFCRRHADVIRSNHSIDRRLLYFLPTTKNSAIQYQSQLMVGCDYAGRWARFFSSIN